MYICILYRHTRMHFQYKMSKFLSGTKQGQSFFSFEGGLGGRGKE